MDVKEKIDAIVYLIIENWLRTTDSFLKLIREEFNKLGLEIRSKVVIEFLLFDLNLCDRQIFHLAGVKEREIIMDEIVIKLLDLIRKCDENFLKEKFGHMTTGNIDKYFEYFYKIAPAMDFIEKYNKRQMEYSVYKKYFAEKDESPKDTLLWEFGKKIATLVRGGPDIAIVMAVLTLITRSLVFYSISLKSIFEVKEE